MRLVHFSQVPVGNQFKETRHGAWHLKDSTQSGIFKADGLESNPRFTPDEMVWVDDDTEATASNPLGLIYPPRFGYTPEEEIKDLRAVVDAMWSYLDEASRRSLVKTTEFETIIEKATGMSAEHLEVADSEHFPGWMYSAPV